jgi:hypothetical protein
MPRKHREPTLYDILDETGTTVILPMVTYADARFILGADLEGTKRRLAAGAYDVDDDRIFTNRYRTEDIG